MKRTLRRKSEEEGEEKESRFSFAASFFSSIYLTLANNIQIAQGANLGQLQL